MANIFIGGAVSGSDCHGTPIRRANKFFDEQKPWALIKVDREVCVMWLYTVYMCAIDSESLQFIRSVHFLFLWKNKNIPITWATYLEFGYDSG